MNSLPDAIRISNLTRRLPGFITDRVFITLVLAFSGLAILDQTQAYQSMRFSLQSMKWMFIAFFLESIMETYSWSVFFWCL